MNSIKKAICIAAIAASAGAQASGTFEAESNDTIATAQNLGSLVSGSEANVFGLRYDLAPLLNSSVDYYKFSIASTLNLTFSVATRLGPTGGNDPLVGLFSSSGTLIDMNDDIDSFNLNYDSLLTRSVSAGTYYVAVTGYNENVENDFSGAGDKNWSYVLTISAAPVPEPESYAMFLAGLGIIGAVARRRKAA